MTHTERLKAAHSLISIAEQQLALLPPASDGSDMEQSARVMLKVALRDCFPIAARAFGLEGEPFGPIPPELESTEPRKKRKPRAGGMTPEQHRTLATLLIHESTDQIREANRKEATAAGKATAPTRKRAKATA